MVPKRLRIKDATSEDIAKATEAFLADGGTISKPDKPDTFKRKEWRPARDRHSSSYDLLI